MPRTTTYNKENVDLCLSIYFIQRFGGSNPTPKYVLMIFTHTSGVGNTASSNYDMGILKSPSRMFYLILTIG